MRNLFLNPALKGWAILNCPAGTWFAGYVGEVVWRHAGLDGSRATSRIATCRSRRGFPPTPARCARSNSANNSMAGCWPGWSLLWAWGMPPYRNHERAEVAPIQRQQHLGPSCGSEEHRAVFGRTKHGGSVHRPNVPYGNEPWPNLCPGWGGRCRQTRNVPCHLCDHVTTRHQRPTVWRCQVKQGARGAGRTPASCQHHAGIEKQVHSPARKRRIASSSSSIHVWSCSAENCRGSGKGACSLRNVSARKSNNSALCPDGSSSAARSISTNDFMAPMCHWSPSLAIAARPEGFLRRRRTTPSAVRQGAWSQSHPTWR